jgi:hypothetical protein
VTYRAYAKNSWALGRIQWRRVRIKVSKHIARKYVASVSMQEIGPSAPATVAVPVEFPSTLYASVPEVCTNCAHCIPR